MEINVGNDDLQQAILSTDLLAPREGIRCRPRDAVVLGRQENE
jgi:hypothetical protein